MSSRSEFRQDSPPTVASDRSLRGPARKALINSIFRSFVEAELALIDAPSTVSEYEKAAKLARLNELRIRRDPNSTDEDIAAAKEVRKNAELAATIDDVDLQQRIEFAERNRPSAPAGAAAKPSGS